MRKPKKCTPMYRQQIAALLYGYGPITLRREGDRAIVEIEYNGKIYPVIREHLDGNFCHTVEPLGIEAVITGQKGIEPPEGIEALPGKRIRS